MAAAAAFTLAAAFNYTVTRNVTYGLGLVDCPFGMLVSGSRCKEHELKMDVYAPTGAGVPVRKPALITMHGGGNSGGDRDQHVIYGTAEYFAERGFVSFNIDYRLAPQKGAAPRFPTGAAEWTPKWPSAYPAVRDLKAAVRYVRAHAGEYGVDPDKIAVTGGSAGATNAVTVGATFDGDYKDELNATEDPTLASTHLEEKSTVSVVYSHWASDGEIDLIQGFDPKHTARYAATNAPVIEFHGSADPTINISHAYAVQAAYKKTGVPYELHVLPGCGHGAWCYGCGKGMCGCKSGTSGYCSHMDEVAFPFVTKHLGL
eukprot:TRINITY_DN3659_c0_g1_i2.p1 TRINITY_DN3659_c0_g1~~TRINITY_DN3659_c0_g1_i2.p1  ORF type:complete len:336 (+),score=108.07 TRINITY_DN3659_c0_g1_i2:63-1010(+)